MNIYHRYINVPVDVPMPKKFEQPSDVFRNYNVGSEVIPKELHNWLNQFNLMFSTVVEGFYSPPGGYNSIVHTDVPGKPTQNNPINDFVKINFTWGPKNSTTRWWNVKDENLYYTTKINPPDKDDTVEENGFYDLIYLADPKDCNMMCERVINRPSILNVSQLHSTYNPGDTDRWTLSLVMMHKSTQKVVKWYEAMEIFKGLLHED